MEHGQSKKDKVKDIALDMESSFTLRQLLFFITGSRAGARWQHAKFEVSLSTVRRAVEELVEQGKLRPWYIYGHAFDECWYARIDEE